jgi:hypothetical protein
VAVVAAVDTAVDLVEVEDSAVGASIAALVSTVLV